MAGLQARSGLVVVLANRHLAARHANFQQVIDDAAQNARRGQKPEGATGVSKIKRSL
jgi:hypothetical protein